jgi:hypothetical protein
MRRDCRRSSLRSRLLATCDEWLVEMVQYPHCRRLCHYPRRTTTASSSIVPVLLVDVPFHYLQKSDQIDAGMGDKIAQPALRSIPVHDKVIHSHNAVYMNDTTCRVVSSGNLLIVRGATWDATLREPAPNYGEFVRVDAMYLRDVDLRELFNGLAALFHNPMCVPDIVIEVCRGISIRCACGSGSGSGSIKRDLLALESAQR